MAETTTMDNVNTTAVVEQRNGILSNVRRPHLTQVLKNLSSYCLCICVINRPNYIFLIATA